MFQLQVVSSRPMTDMDEVEALAFELLMQIGYLSRVENLEDAKGDMAFRMFVECFLLRGDRPWSAEDIATLLETTKPTVYRHITKLKNMDLLEVVPMEDSEGRPRRGYRLRYGDLSKAWGLVEAHVNMALQNYRRNIDHLQKLVDSGRKR